MSILMGFDVQKIPLLKTVAQNIEQEIIYLSLNDQQIILKNIQKLSIKTLPPPGGVNYLNKP